MEINLCSCSIMTLGYSVTGAAEGEVQEKEIQTDTTFLAIVYSHMSALKVLTEV